MRLKIKKPRGSILLFTIVLVIPLLLIVAGIAVDVSMLYVVRSELNRSMDAAALAGAGNLGFDASAFPAARAAAVLYAANNPYLQSGVITLDPTPPPSAASNHLQPITALPIGYGDITLGVWNGATGDFDVPTCDINLNTCKHASGWPYYNMINAVRCRTRQALPTYFLNLIGLTSLNTWGESIAPSYPPMSPPPSGCTFPIGVSDCPFRNEGSSTYGSGGCGALITFTDATVNTSGWVNLGADLGGTTDIEHTPSASTLDSEIGIAAGSGSGCIPPPAPGTTVGMNGGMVQSAYDLLANIRPGDGGLQSGPNYFVANYTDEVTLKNNDGDTVYSGSGWKVYVPIVYSNNNCTVPENMNSPHTIAAYAEIVIVQVINNGWCSVNNATTIPGYSGPGPYSNPWSDRCPQPRGNLPPGSRDPNLRAIFAYYSCGKWASPPVIVPAPRAALADRLRLVR